MLLCTIIRTFSLFEFEENAHSFPVFISLLFVVVFFFFADEKRSHFWGKTVVCLFSFCFSSTLLNLLTSHERSTLHPLLKQLLDKYQLMLFAKQWIPHQLLYTHEEKNAVFRKLIKPSKSQEVILFAGSSIDVYTHTHT